MSLFYLENIENTTLALSPEESRHCMKSLRLKIGDKILITNGKGKMVEAVIMDDNINKCIVEVNREIENNDDRLLKLHIGIAPTKNSDRMEWFVEKAVEIGIEKISFLQCVHSERERVNLERMNRVAIAAMKQSNRTLLPTLELITLTHFFEIYGNNHCNKLIAWCDATNNTQLSHYQFNTNEIILLIGPEGDFSDTEIKEAETWGFQSIKLGNQRLRTETAGLYGCVVIAAKSLEIKR